MLARCNLLEYENHVQTLIVEVVTFSVFKGPVSLPIHLEIPETVPLLDQTGHFVKREQRSWYECVLNLIL